MGSKSAIGIGNGICFKQVRDKGGGSYIDPLVRDSLVGVWIADRNTNESPTRNIIKNTIKDKGGDLELLNFSYKLNSGYGKYEEDFTSWRISKSGIVSTINVNSIHITHIKEPLPDNLAFFENETTTNRNFNIKLKISGLTSDMKCTINNQNSIIKELANGINEISIDLVAGWYGFMIIKLDGSIIGDCDVTITQIPSFEGALVTDGVDDLITSTKTVKEMLGGSNEVTVVSMIHQIELSSQTTINNNIRSESVAHVVCRNICSFAGKTGIYGYSRQINTSNPPTLINNILGDKKDYTAEGNSALDPTDKFFVQGYKYIDTIDEVSPIAYYWTFIANKVLTIDQINQVISYFNLDKHVKPDIIYDTIRQGITNENHASFNDELVDFSGNEHNMKIYNSAWNKESGINDEGALVLNGVSDFGKVTGMPIYKDYTVVANREIIDGLAENADGGVALKGESTIANSFIFDFKNGVYSFAKENSKTVDTKRFISYQSKYVNNGVNIDAGTGDDTDVLYLAKLGKSDRYSKLALWSFLLFPYSLSEFLLERQLKRYKLGTLYPNMVEFRPIIKNNNQYRRIDFYTQSWDKKICPGDYVPINSILRANIYLNNELSELQSFRINGVNVTFVKSSADKTAYNIGNIPIAKSPQKIDIIIYEYIRFEDIILPYPAIVNLSQDGKSITWGDKLKVGSEVTFVNHTNLLPDLYTVSDGVQYNGTYIFWNTSIRVEKSMVFVNPHSYKKANEPNCILAPQTLRIPNSSYKILGYIPDLTGKGNHGRLNNFAYTEESGANEDGSIRFDGIDDHITIPTLAHGSKCILMKVNWNKDDLILYDQRRDNNLNSFAIYIPNFNNEDAIAYSSMNDGKTYIDGVLNTSIKVSQLKDVTHNITITNSNSNNNNTVSPTIGSNVKHNAFYAQMTLFDFMLFPEISSEEEIKELNDIVGIEGGYVERPEYY